MVAVSMNSDASLAAFLHARALVSSPRRLFIDVIVGLTVASLSIWLRPSAWPLFASAGFCLMAYGVWAVAERHIEQWTGDETRRQRGTWRALSGVSALIGLLALGIMLSAFVMLSLGTWIS